MKPDVYTDRDLTAAAYQVMVEQTLERRAMVTRENMWSLWAADLEVLQHFIEREPLGHRGSR